MVGNMKKYFMAYALLPIMLVYGAETLPLASQCDARERIIQEYINRGGDLNVYPWTDVESSIINRDGDPYYYRGPITLLGRAVIENCTNAVRLLLENGANANQYSGDATPLLYNYVNFIDSNSIADNNAREQARIPMRIIRDLLIQHGAFADWAPRSRRAFIRDFRNYMAGITNTDKSITYVYCASNSVEIISAQGVNVYEYASPDGHPSWQPLADQIQSWINTLGGNGSIKVSIIGHADLDMMLQARIQRLFEKVNIEASRFAVPNSIPCDPKTIMQLFVTHTDAATQDLMRELDEQCPGMRENPFSEAEQELRAF